MKAWNFETRSDGQFELGISYSKNLNFANAYNGDQLIDAVSLRALGEASIHMAIVSIEVRSQGTLLSLPWSMNLDVLDARGIVEYAPDLHFDSALLADVIDLAPAELYMSVFENGKEIIAATWDLNLLPSNAWILEEPEEKTVANLATFVIPNHPAVATCVKAISETLARETGDPSIAGYQVAHRVETIVKAAYDSVANLGIAYSMPPASWDLPAGQRIRNPQEVLESRAGTCLDTAAAFASILENMGLFPVMVVAPGHAFVGYWTADGYELRSQFASMANPVMRIADVQNEIDQGFIKLFETTVVCSGPSQLPFEDACTLGLKYAGKKQNAGLGAKSSEFLLVDILGARRKPPRGILPLPAKVVKPDGTVEQFEYKPTNYSLQDVRDAFSSGSANLPADRSKTKVIPRQVQIWLDSLLDIGLRNPLINVRDNALNIRLVTSKGSLAVVEDLLQSGSTLRISPAMIKIRDDSGSLVEADLSLDQRNVSDSSEVDQVVATGLAEKTLFGRVTEDNYVARLRKIANNAKAIAEETGSNGLFLALGSLTWSPKDRPEVRSPLLLVPLRIVAKNRNTEFYVQIDDSAPVTPNFSLIEKLKRDYEIELGQLSELPLDENGIDLPLLLSRIRADISKHKLSGFRVDEDALIGFFNFSTYRMWKDLNDNWELFEQSPFIKHLIRTPNEPFGVPLPEVEAAELEQLLATLPITSDASQTTAVAHALAGRSFVLQGPPGTGKSQTITNILASSMAAGKKVLFVAEKKDALDVVKERLNAVGLASFALDLHDRSMSLKSVKQQLSDSLTRKATPDVYGYASAVQSYTQAVSGLSTYRDKLHEVGPFGLSVFGALEQLLTLNDAPSMNVSGAFLKKYPTKDMRAPIAETMANVADWWPATGAAADNPWSLTGLKREELSQESVTSTISNSVRELAVALEKISAPGLRLVTQCSTSEDLLRFAQIEASALSVDRLASEIVAESATSEAKELLRVGGELLRLVSNTKFNLTRLHLVEVDDLMREAREAIAGVALLKNARLTKIGKQIFAYLGVNASCESEEVLALLDHLGRIQKSYTSFVQIVSESNPALALSPESILDPATLEEFMHEKSQLATLSDSIEAIDAPLESLKCSDLGDVALFAVAVKRLLATLIATEANLRLWTGDLTFGKRLVATVPEMLADLQTTNLNALVNWVNAAEALEPLKAAGLDEARLQILEGNFEANDVGDAFSRGALEGILKIELSRLGLGNFDSTSLLSNVKKLGGNYAAIIEMMPELLANKLLSLRGFSADASRGATGDLLLKLKQQNSRGSVRALIQSHWQVISQMTPCVLASPDSAVRFLEAKQTNFDIVIFDEASQIRVANSIGALGRGVAAIIVGDTKQMPPTSVAVAVGGDYQETNVLDENQEDYTPLTGDLESILSQAEVSRVPSILLNWHYRSENEELIAFSNKAYYGNELSSFPSPIATSASKGVSFVASRGQFIRTSSKTKEPKRTNPVEAALIVKEIERLIDDPVTASDSIGVVTFNKEQQALILDLLQSSKNPSLIAALEREGGEEPIFVKNLETVQGSERDRILFSIAFSAKTPDSEDIPLNFGPLTHVGGERRLNVAITRARKHVTVFCSFEPNALLRKNPQSTGLQHLARYLIFAQQGPEQAGLTLQPKATHMSRYKTQIASKLEARGLVTQTNVGLSDFKVDIGIALPEGHRNFKMGLLLDGPDWGARKTTTDRDLLPTNFLKTRMKWEAIERIWLPSWLRDPNSEVERILASLRNQSNAPALAESAQELPANQELAAEGYTKVTTRSLGSAQPPSEFTMPKIATESEPITTNPSSFVRARVLLIGSPNDLQGDVTAAISEKIRKLTLILTQAEGPVSLERRNRFIAKCFGVPRLSRAFESAITEIELPGHETDIDDFVYPQNVRIGHLKKWMISGGDERRTIPEVCREEIALAAIQLVREGLGYKANDLRRDLARTFDSQVLSAPIAARIDTVVQGLITDGRLHDVDGYLQVVTS